MLSSPEAAIEWLQSKDWWGNFDGVQELGVPRVIAVTIPKTWPQDVQAVDVSIKKEIFYRFLLPLVMHANAMVLDYRAQLTQLHARLMAGESVTSEELTGLDEISELFRIDTLIASPNQPVEKAELSRFMDEALYKLDVIPAGLAMGQAAYESGYGTSRFATQGNALFGQWAFGDVGIVPERQREELGNYRIAAFDWPFDSVRSYFINLNSHPAYEEFRQLRADLRRQGKHLDSQTLADGLSRYSELGQEYVETLKSIIRVNDLAAADKARFRDEPMSFIIGAEDEADERSVRAELEVMRETGELQEIVRQMQITLE